MVGYVCNEWTGKERKLACYGTTRKNERGWSEHKRRPGIRNQKSGNVTQHHLNSTFLPERENGRKNGKYGEYGFH
jgi:hypothetical protein